VGELKISEAKPAEKSTNQQINKSTNNNHPAVAEAMAGEANQ
jgi:hypothetical protein